MVCLMKVKDLAKYLGWNIQTVYRNMESIPHLKFNGCYRFERKEIDRWLHEKQI